MAQHITEQVLYQELCCIGGRNLKWTQSTDRFFCLSLMFQSQWEEGAWSEAAWSNSTDEGATSSSSRGRYCQRHSATWTEETQRWARGWGQLSVLYEFWRFLCCVVPWFNDWRIHGQLDVPRYHLTTYGGCLFICDIAAVWNSLPDSIKDTALSLASYENHLLLSILTYTAQRKLVLWCHAI